MKTFWTAVELVVGLAWVPLLIAGLMLAPIALYGKLFILALLSFVAMIVFINGNDV